VARVAVDDGECSFRGQAPGKGTFLGQATKTYCYRVDWRGVVVGRTSSWNRFCVEDADVVGPDDGIVQMPRGPRHRNFDVLEVAETVPRLGLAVKVLPLWLGGRETDSLWDQPGQVVVVRKECWTVKSIFGRF